MTVTTAETLSVGGVVLNTLAKNIESLTGRLKVPAIRTDNLLVPGRHGRIRTTTKYYEEGQIILPMWVKGSLDDGSLPTNPRSQFYANVDALTSLFRPGDGIVDLVHTLPDGSIREALCEVTEVIDFSTVGYGVPLGKFSVNLRVPAAFWQDSTLTSVDLAATWNANIPNFAGGTAPIEDGIFTITGPATNIKLQSLYNGAPLINDNYVIYAGTVPAAETLAIDSGNWKLTGGGGFVPDYSQFSHIGPPRWLTLVPGTTGNGPGLKMTCTGATGATKLNVQARRKYLVG